VSQSLGASTTTFLILEGWSSVAALERIPVSSGVAS
jgi:hypothetical protein